MSWPGLSVYVRRSSSQESWSLMITVDGVLSDWHQIQGSCYLWETLTSSSSSSSQRTSCHFLNFKLCQSWLNHQFRYKILKLFITTYLSYFSGLVNCTEVGKVPCESIKVQLRADQAGVTYLGEHGVLLRDRVRYLVLEMLWSYKSK